MAMVAGVGFLRGTWMVVAACALLGPGLGRAGEVDLSDNPGTANQVFFPGPHIMTPATPPFSLSLTTPSPYTTSDGNFRVSMSALTARDVRGLFITYNVTAKVTDLTGIKSTLTLDVSQAYDVNAAIFMAVRPSMTATFVDVGGAPHDNDVRARLAIGGFPLDDFFAEDTMGPMVTVPGVPLSSPPNVFTTTSPMTVQTPIEFQFDVNPVAGDSIAIPLNITLAMPGFVPEPAGWAMMAVGLGLVGARLRHRRRRSPTSLIGAADGALEAKFAR